MLRRLVTRRGTLFYDADFGMDVRMWLHAGIHQQSLWELATLVQREVEKDERVRSARVVATPEGDSVRLAVQVQVAGGAFRLVVRASQLQVEQLREGERDGDATGIIGA